MNSYLDKLDENADSHDTMVYGFTMNLTLVSQEATLSLLEMPKLSYQHLQNIKIEHGEAFMATLISSRFSYQPVLQKIHNSYMVM